MGNDVSKRIQKIIKLLKGLIKNITHTSVAPKKPAVPRLQASVIPRSEHNISRSAINPNALKVLYRLHQAGYEAYLVGGCVRDLLLGRQPKDFDVATNALPDEVRSLFRNCMLIGRRFRLAHILFGKEIIEVATFRAHHENASEQHGRSHKGMIVRDNVYGTIEEDAMRRDFTVNALYYNIADFSITDYLNGMKDLEARQLHIIGDPEQRYLEDPVRLLRAIRFAGKLGLSLSPETESPIIALSHLLQEVSSSRLFQEISKFFHEGASADTFKLLQKYHLFQQLFPLTAPLLKHKETSQLIHNALTHTDQRIRENKTVSPAFLFTVFLWPAILHEIKKNHRQPNYMQIDAAIHTVVKKQKQRLEISRRLLLPIREICLLQYRFSQRRGKQPYRILEHPRFRAAYDLLLLRAESGEPVQEISAWWTKFHLGDHSIREQMLKDSGTPKHSKPNQDKDLNHCV